MYHWMLVAPQALNTVLPVADSFSNQEMAHIYSYPRTSVYKWNNKNKFVKEKNKASFCQLLRRSGSGD